MYCTQLKGVEYSVEMDVQVEDPLTPARFCTQCGARGESDWNGVGASTENILGRMCVVVEELYHDGIEVKKGSDEFSLIELLLKLRFLDKDILCGSCSSNVLDKL